MGTLLLLVTPMEPSMSGKLVLARPVSSTLDMYALCVALAGHRMAVTLHRAATTAIVPCRYGKPSVAMYFIFIKIKTAFLLHPGRLIGRVSPLAVSMLQFRCWMH